MNLRFAAVLSAALALTGTAHAAVRVAVTPSAVLVDAPVDVRVTGLATRTSVTLQATTKDYLGKLWRSRLAVRADAHGVYDTNRNMRLFWSMQCVSGATGCDFGVPLGPTDVDIDVIRAGRRRRGGSALAPRRCGRRRGQTDTTLAAQGFVGAYFAPPAGAAPAPAVLAIGGSEGGYGPYPAALLASHGYPSLSLAYFKEPGLPQTLKDIPLEYFATALRWLAAQPGVDPKRVVVLGGSRGGEGALLIGSTYPDLVHAVIADVPSDQVNPVVARRRRLCLDDRRQGDSRTDRSRSRRSRDRYSPSAAAGISSGIRPTRSRASSRAPARTGAPTSSASSTPWPDTASLPYRTRRRSSLRGSRWHRGSSTSTHSAARLGPTPPLRSRRGRACSASWPRSRAEASRTARRRRTGRSARA